MHSLKTEDSKINRIIKTGPKAYERIEAPRGKK